MCLIRGSATAGAVIGESAIEHGKRKGCNGLRQGADITFPCAICPRAPSSVFRSEAGESYTMVNRNNSMSQEVASKTRRRV